MARSLYNPWQGVGELETKGLPLGTDTETGKRLSISPSWLATHLHLLGPTGCGKSRLLLWIFQRLASIPHATIILINPKGDLCHMASDWAVANGLTKRLILFDPGEENNIVGYNPLKPNGMPIATHAKAVREGIRSSWGQSSFDQTAQLARFLYLALCAARERELTLIEAVGLLRAGSKVRKAVLPAIQDPYIREALDYFDSLREARQEELAASTLARLEAFVFDPIIRRSLVQQTRSLDLAQVLTDHKILLVNLEQYRPLRPDDVRLLGRLLINDILAHVFERPTGQRSPVYLLIDELATFATDDLLIALEQGRELGLHCVLAHQHIGQLLDEDGSGQLLNSVMNNARTKIVFGGSWAKDLKDLTEELVIDQFDPWTIKDEIHSLELDPIETTRTSRTTSYASSLSHGLSMPTSVTVGESQTESRGTNAGITRGIQESTSKAETRAKSRSKTRTFTRGKTKAHGWADSEGENQSRGHSSGSSDGSQYSSGTGTATALGDPDAPTITSSYTASGINSARSSSDNYADGTSEAHTESGSAARTTSLSFAKQKAKTKSKTVGKTKGASLSLEQGTSENTAHGKTRNISKGVTPSITEGETWGESETEQPFYEYIKRRPVSSRTFLNLEEFLTIALQKIKELPRGHFVLKVPGHRALFVCAPFVETPRITARLRAIARERIFSQPCYSRSEEIEAEERARIKRIHKAPIKEAEIMEEGLEPKTFRHKKNNLDS
jgi:hypothetical protein